MLHAMSGWGRRIIGQFGRCPYCMRKAFLAMAAAWGLSAFTMNFADSPSLSVAAELIAATLTLLWAAHILAFASRSAFASRISAQLEVGDAQGLVSRRSVLPMFVKVLAVATVASALPRLALAGGCSASCPNGSSSKGCPEGQSCSCYCNGYGNAVCGDCS